MKMIFCILSFSRDTIEGTNVLVNTAPILYQVVQWHLQLDRVSFRGGGGGGGGAMAPPSHRFALLRKFVVDNKMYRI